ARAGRHREPLPARPGSSRRAAVYLLEDLHWLDRASEALFAATHELLKETPTLLVLTFRPEYDGLWLEKSSYRQLALQPLGAGAFAELLRDLLGTDPSVVALADRIRERTGGNPFFIEEVVQALVEAGSLTGAKGAYRLVRPVEELAIPPTVHAVLAARIDRLPEREKAVLQTAAVSGPARRGSRPSGTGVRPTGSGRATGPSGCITGGRSGRSSPACPRRRRPSRSASWRGGTSSTARTPSGRGRTTHRPCSRRAWR